MKIKITKNGYLKIWRRGEYQFAFCPFSKNDEDETVIKKWCGDWCPLFELYETEGLMTGTILGELRLCHRTIKLEEWVYV